MRSFYPSISEALGSLCSGGPALSENREDLTKFNGDQELQEFIWKKDSKMFTFERLPLCWCLHYFSET